MSNTNSRTSAKINYTISNAQMHVLLNKLPSLKENNKNTEFNLSAQVRGEIITEGLTSQESKVHMGPIGSINIHFSYDFVNDRWFLNDTKVEVIGLDRG